jgi:type VI secretion system protein VasD
MQLKLSRFRASAQAVLLVILAACASTPAVPKPTAVEVTLVSAPDANSGPGGEAQPLSVRIFQISGAGAFETADFFALKQSPQTALGADFLDQTEVLLAPGATETVRFEADPATKHLGFAVGYRELDKSVWRVVVPVTGESVSAQINVDKHKVSVAAPSD